MLAFYGIHWIQILVRIIRGLVLDIPHWTLVLIEVTLELRKILEANIRGGMFKDAVQTETSFSIKFQRTDIAPKWFNTRMDSLMRGQMSFQTELHLTHVALERLFGRMERMMLTQALSGTEFQVTHTTLKGSYVGMIVRMM